MTTVDYVVARESDILFIKDALETFQSELRQLELMHEWFYSDARDQLEEAYRTLNNILEVETDEQDDEECWKEEAERLFAELCIKRERANRYIEQVETDE